MHQRHRQPLGIVVDPVLLLPPRGIKPLPKIPLAVQQADRHQRQRLIRSLLDQIPGQSAQPAGIHRQRMMHAELRARKATGRSAAIGPTDGRRRSVAKASSSSAARAIRSESPAARASASLDTSCSRRTGFSPQICQRWGSIARNTSLPRGYHAQRYVVSDPGQRRERLREPPQRRHPGQTARSERRALLERRRQGLRVRTAARPSRSRNHHDTGHLRQPMPSS